jgi:branched-chain amino acid transport system ATP-binding protein
MTRRTVGQAVTPSETAAARGPDVPSLQVIDLSAGYGQVPAVRGINLHVARGEVVALLGANGAGKSTTLMAIAGVQSLMGGEVRFQGEVMRSPVHVRARAGLCFIPEQRSIISGLSTQDNLRLGRGSVAHALEMFPELRPRLKVRGGLLSGGEQRIATLARALAGEPRVLLADELSLGLAPLIVKRLFKALRQAATERGVGVLVVEQQVRAALAQSDRAYVLQGGEVVLQGRSEDLLKDIVEIETAYFTNLVAGDTGGTAAAG